ncbi:MAG: Protein of unknown function DUF664, partial [uncultured Nocardioidaceae bacterium]
DDPAPCRPVPRPRRRPPRGRAAARGRADHVDRVRPLPAAHPAAQVRRARRRTARPAGGRAVDDVAARPGAPHGRRRAGLVPPTVRRTGRRPALPVGRGTGRRLRRRGRRPRGRRGGLAGVARGGRLRRGVHRGHRPGVRRLGLGRGADLAARAARPHGRGVRTAQRPRRPAARADRRPARAV